MGGVVLAMFKLTKRRVEGLEPQAKDYAVWDRDVRGFGVRVFVSGRKSYIVQYRAGRRTRRYTIGQHGVLTADEARSEARKLLGSVAKGDDPSGERQRRLRAPTVAALCDRYLAEYVAEHCKPTTARDYRAVVARNIKPKLGTLRIEDVTRADIVAFHHSLRATPYLANRAAAMLSKLFNLAEDWGLRTPGSNPARRIRKFREEEKKRFLSDDEQVRLGQVLRQVHDDGTASLYIVSAIMLLILTGCRLNEIRTLKWEYVTPKHLELPDSKTGRRRIPLPREAYDILQSLPRRDGNPYVILGESDTAPLVNLQKAWTRIRKLAKLEDVRMHDLRHTYASVAVMNGIDPFTLKEIMGHRNLQTTLRYAHFADEAVQRAAGSVASRLAGALSRDSTRGPTLRIVG